MKSMLWLRSAILAAVLMCSPMLAVQSHASIFDDLFGWWGGGGSGGGSCPPATAPIDGGLSLLAIAGVGYGIKKMTAGKKDKDKQDK
jgi:hypothetical protein